MLWSRDEEIRIYLSEYIFWVLLKTMKNLYIVYYDL